MDCDGLSIVRLIALSSENCKNKTHSLIYNKKKIKSTSQIYAKYNKSLNNGGKNYTFMRKHDENNIDK